MAELIEFNTARLRLRQWKLSDRECFAKLNADPRVMEYFPSVLGRHESDALADRCEALINERGWSFWATERMDTHEFIGFVGLHIPTANLPFSPCVEVGWRLAVKHWGNGYATEAASGALRVGFEQLGLREIVSFTSVLNNRSRRVMEKLGMTFNEEYFEHPSVPEGSELRQHCLYRMSLKNWLDKNA
jgi:RimJ/RimL family protein N-acetyltransferase